MALNVDVAPTLPGLAGVPLPSRLPVRSRLPLPEGSERTWRDACLYEYHGYPALQGARKNRGMWADGRKLIHFRVRIWRFFCLAPVRLRWCDRTGKHKQAKARLHDNLLKFRCNAMPAIATGNW
jgi:hypothetical protein